MSRFTRIREILLPHWYSKEAVEGTIDYVPKDGDIIITSYPKTGTTWLHYILIQITSRGQSFPAYNDLNAKTVMEWIGAEGIDRLQGLRIYKHHYRYDMVKKNPKSKVLYTYRNPEDTFLSYFHFMTDLHQLPFKQEEFFEEFITGNIEYGCYFEHVLSFMKHKDDDNLLLISYEQLQANPKEEILRIAKFLGEEYFQDISINETLLNEIVNNTSFDNMKQNLKYERKHQTNDMKNPSKTINLFRKGKVGEGKNSLSEKDLKLLHEKAVKVLKGTDVLKEWIKE